MQHRIPVAQPVNNTTNPQMISVEDLVVEKASYTEANQDVSKLSRGTLTGKYYEQIEILESKQTAINNELMNFKNPVSEIKPYVDTLKLQKSALDEYITRIQAEFKEIDEDYDADQHSRNVRFHSLNLALIDCNIMLYNNDLSNSEEYKNNFKKSNSLLRKDSTFWASAELLAYTVAGLLAIAAGIALIPVWLHIGYQLLPMIDQMIDHLPSWQNPYQYLGGVAAVTLGGIMVGVAIAGYGWGLLKTNVYNPCRMFHAANKLENHSTTLSNTDVPDSVVSYRKTVAGAE